MTIKRKSLSIGYLRISSIYRCTFHLVLHIHTQPIHTQPVLGCIEKAKCMLWCNIDIIFVCGMFWKNHDVTKTTTFAFTAIKKNKNINFANKQ